MAKSVSRRKPVPSDRETLRKAVLTAAEAAGKQCGGEGLVSYLTAQALGAPGSFLTLLGKVFAASTDRAEPQITRIEIVTPQTCMAEQPAKEEGEN